MQRDMAHKPCNNRDLNTYLQNVTYITVRYTLMEMTFIQKKVAIIQKYTKNPGNRKKKFVIII